MRFNVIYDIVGNNPVLAGKSAKEWTEDRLSALENGEEFTLVLNRFAPLLNANLVEKTAKILIKSGSQKAVFPSGYLARTKGKGELRINTLPFVGLTTTNVGLIQKKLYREIAVSFVKNGVNILDVDSVYIDSTVRLGKNSAIYPFNVLEGYSVVHENTVLLWGNVISNSVIGANCKVSASYIYDSTVGDNCTVGPFARLRQNARIDNDVRIGDFVEIKNSSLENGVKAAHLAYIGDATVGENTNVGCGTVFANFDGKVKHNTEVGKNVFIGCNSNLIAPLTIGDNSFIAGGSTITENIAENTFAISRVKQVTKKNKRG